MSFSRKRVRIALVRKSKHAAGREKPTRALDVLAMTVSSTSTLSLLIAHYAPFYNA